MVIAEGFTVLSIERENVGKFRVQEVLGKNKGQEKSARPVINTGPAREPRYYNVVTRVPDFDSAYSSAKGRCTPYSHHWSNGGPRGP